MGARRWGGSAGMAHYYGLEELHNVARSSLSCLLACSLACLLGCDGPCPGAWAPRGSEPGRLDRRCAHLLARGSASAVLIVCRGP